MIVKEEVMVEEEVIIEGRKTNQKRRIVGGAPPDPPNVARLVMDLGVKEGVRETVEKYEAALSSVEAATSADDVRTTIKDLGETIKSEAAVSAPGSIVATTGGTVKEMVITIFGGTGNTKTLVDDYNTAVDTFAGENFGGDHIEEIKNWLKAYPADTHLFKEEKDGTSVTYGSLNADAPSIDYNKFKTYAAARAVLLGHITSEASSIPHSDLGKWAESRLLDEAGCARIILEKRIESAERLTITKIKECFGAKGGEFTVITDGKLGVDEMKASLVSLDTDVSDFNNDTSGNGGTVRAEQILGSLFLKVTDDNATLINTFVEVAKALSSPTAGAWLPERADLEDIPLDVGDAVFVGENDVKRLFPRDGGTGASFAGGIQAMLDQLNTLAEANYDKTGTGGEVEVMRDALHLLIEPTQLKETGGARRTMFMIHMRKLIIQALTADPHDGGKKLIHQKFMDNILGLDTHAERMNAAEIILEDAEVDCDKLVGRATFGTPYADLKGDEAKAVPVKAMLALFPRLPQHLDANKIATIIKHFGGGGVVTMEKDALLPNVVTTSFADIIQLLKECALSKATPEQLNKCKSPENFAS